MNYTDIEPNYWSSLLHEVWADTWEIVVEHSVASILVIVLIEVLIIRSKHEKWGGPMKVKFLEFVRATVITSILFIIVFLVHVCVLTPAKLFIHQNEKMINIQKELEALKKTQQTSISWQPPEIYRYTQNIEILFGGHFEDLNGKTYFGNPLFLDVQKLRDKSVLVPLGNVTASVSIIKNRIFVDLDIPTKGKPIQIRQGESVEPLPVGWDWNCDSDMLEIVDDQDQAVFQEESVTNGIWIRGAVQIDRQVSYASWTAQIDNEPRVAFNPSDLQLSKAFLYPSSKFQGKRIPK
jgi:hypothetical protein